MSDGDPYARASGVGNVRPEEDECNGVANGPSVAGGAVRAGGLTPSPPPARGGAGGTAAAEGAATEGAVEVAEVAIGTAGGEAVCGLLTIRGEQKRRSGGPAGCVGCAPEGAPSPLDPIAPALRRALPGVAHVRLGICQLHGCAEGGGKAAG